MSTQEPSNQPEPINDEKLDAVNGGTTPPRKEISFCDPSEMIDTPREKKFFGLYVSEKQQR